MGGATSGSGTVASGSGTDALSGPGGFPSGSETPASGPVGGGGTVQLPASEPGGTAHSAPIQQSALVVHRPPKGTHLLPHVSRPVTGSGTHGSRSQQSPEKAQLPPGGTQAARALQRGMPVRSSWQHSLPLMQAQQSFRLLVVAPWQTAVFV